MAMSEFHFGKAQREDIRPLVGVFGPTGGGKTKSMLRMALGMQRVIEQVHGQVGTIALLDTENGRAGIYAPKPGAEAEPPLTFDFLHAILSKPFSPPRYADALQEMQLAEPVVGIIDGLTPEWTGDGGMMDFHDRETERLKGNSYAAWNRVKRGHTSMMAVLEQLNFPLFVGFRAKEKTAQEGREIVDLGWRAISEGELPYQMTFSMLMGKAQPGIITMNRDLSDHIKTYDTAPDLIRDGELATEEVGERIWRWAYGKEE